MSTSRSVLVLQDEHQPDTTFAIIFQRAGLSVTKLCGLEEILEIQDQHFDVIFVELSLPDNEGIQRLYTVRCLYPETPIILLSGHIHQEKVFSSFPLQIDDHFTKPVDPGLLLARVQDMMATRAGSPRGQGSGKSSVQTGLLCPDGSARFLSRGAFSLDLLARHVTVRSRLVTLSPVLFTYLVVLVRHAPEPVSACHLLFEAEGRQLPDKACQRMVRRRISSLRKAVEQNPSLPALIITVRGIGYKITIDHS